jgi:hypothetical protein
MKNWNDAGTVHYDAATNRAYQTVTVDFEAWNLNHSFELKIPMDIRKALKLEHYDKALDHGRRVFLTKVSQRLVSGCFNQQKLIDEGRRAAMLAMLERLYEDFTLEQARAGNQVWATPETMQDVGPRPENDFD